MARTSTSQNLLKGLLVRGAAAVGISDIENASELNTADGRPQLAAVIEHLRPGEALAVWRFDRLGPSLPHLLETVAHLETLAFNPFRRSGRTLYPAGTI
ncbi:hypothetical protein FFI94_015480 [Rhodococcus sp. KBS0724]|nr:hypothetical protein FFI94_015480 [Rhodococcus sp. KBS0724]